MWEPDVNIRCLLSLSPPYFSRQGPSSNQELTNSARLSGHEDLGSSCPCSSGVTRVDHHAWPYVSTRVPARVSFLQGMCVMTEPSSHPLLLSFILYFGNKMWLHSLSWPSVSYITQACLKVNTVLLLNLLSARVISIHHATIPSGNF